MSSRRLRISALLTLLTFGATGCYNTYHLERDDFVQLQRAEEDQDAVVKTREGASLRVTTDTPLYVRSDGGRRYPITPYNFLVSSSQLVAPDRDYILMVDQLESYEVDVPSTGKTIALIGAGVAAVTGLIIGVIATSGKKSFQ